MSAERVHVNYVVIWGWLIALMIGSLVVTVLPLGRSTMTSLIFAIAGIKAALVALNYMHLKTETWLICALAIIPVLIVIAMTLVLLPDIVVHH